MTGERLEVSRGPMVILVVSDPDTCFLIRDSLRRADIETVLEMESLEDVYNWARQGLQNRADVIIVGDNLPPRLEGKEGQRTAHKIREELPGVRIIALSFDPASFGDEKVLVEDLYHHKVDLGEVVNSVRV